jgi:putative membrane protein
MKKQIWITLLSALVLVGALALNGFAAEGLAKADKKFAMEAADGGLMEVQLGQKAQSNAQSPDIKKFGERMVADHSKANDELKALAQQKGITLPTEMSGKHKKMMDKLSGTTGANFDRLYMEMMVKDHMKDVAEFRKATKKVKDQDLNAWATKTLPTLESHLQQAREVAQKLGIKTK